VSQPTVKRTLIQARDRVAAIKQALDDRAPEINSQRALVIEIDCGYDEFTIKITNFDKYAHRPGPPEEHPYRFNP
jgi:hypothetical protein